MITLYQIDTLDVFSCLFNIELVNLIHSSVAYDFIIHHGGRDKSDALSLVGFGDGSKHLGIIN